MTAGDIYARTGVESRRYTFRSLEDIALEAASAALRRADCAPDDIGAVVFCSCTSTRPIPSIASWLTGELGIVQTHASVDLVAACAGFSYGIGECIRLLQEVHRPVLLVCAEVFSDKIGTVRTSRMLFGDGAAALIIGPAPCGTAGDVLLFQTYAGGAVDEVNSIIWPNPSFDNNLTVSGPEVRSLVKRYLSQMIDELREIADPSDPTRSLLEGIELVVPHQANRLMVEELASDVGLSASQLYFNIAQVGNVSAASIPLALYDAICDGTLRKRQRVFTPSFGAGAVAGYVVLDVDPAIACT